MYEHLHPEKITQTIRRLHARVRLSFPDAGLASVAAEVAATAERAEQRIGAILRPNLVLRVLVALLLLTSVVLVGLYLREWFADRRHSTEVLNLAELLQTVEAVLGSAFFLGAGVLTLITLERRLKRNKALDAIHELRAMAHIIDLHQMHKDPGPIASTEPPEGSRGERRLSAAETTRYLDYCSEMLTLIGNLAALYVQGFNDPVVLDAVDDVAHLTTGLSGKIWQKIMILEQSAVRGDA